MSRARPPGGSSSCASAAFVQAAVSRCTRATYGLEPPGTSPRVAPPMDPEGTGSASRRIAFGTLARLAGEAVGKVASLAFFVVIARELGEEQFGDFIFAMSLSTVFLIVAGLGLQEMVG